MEERRVQCFGFPGQRRVRLHLEAGLAQHRQPAAGDERVRILMDGHHGRDARADQRLGTGARAALVRTRLQRRVKSGAASKLSGLLQSDDLGVLDAGPGMKAPAHDLAVFHEYGANGRIGRCSAGALPGQLKRFG